MNRWSFALLLLALTILLRAPVLPWPAIEEDEAGHMVAAAAMAQGERPYVEAVVDQKTPLLWYLFAGVMTVAGLFNTVAIRLFTDLSVWITALLLWRLGTRLSSGGAGRWAAILFTLFSTCSTYKILASNFELHFLPFDVAAYLCLTEALLARRPWWGLGAGAAIATAFLIKQTAGINLVTQIIFVIWLSRLASWRRVSLQTGALIALGFSVTLGLFCVWMLSIGVFSEMRYWVWDFAWRFTAGTAHHMPFWSRLAERWGLWLAGTLVVHYWALRYCLTKSSSPLKACIVLWAILEWIPICLGGRFPIHYFLMALPPLSLMAGLWISPQASLRTYFWGSAPMSRWVARVSLFLLPVAVSWFAAWQIPSINRLYGLHRADHAKLARRITATTAPTDRLFVWGDNPEFYIFAKRLAATRFTWADYFVGRFGIPSQFIQYPQQYDTLVVHRAWPLLFEDFRRHPPRIIIDTSPADLHDFKIFPISKYPLLASYVAQYYDLAWIEDDVHFYVRKYRP